MQANKSIELAMIICVWILEYFRAWWFIDTEEDVVVKEIKRRLHKNGYSMIVALFLNYIDLRNILVHTPFTFKTETETTDAVKGQNTHETIQKFCSVFEEDAEEFELIYKDVMGTL